MDIHGYLCAILLPEDQALAGFPSLLKLPILCLALECLVK